MREKEDETDRRHGIPGEPGQCLAYPLLDRGWEAIAVDDYVDRPDPRQMEILRRKTPAERLQIGLRLCAEARKIKAAALRTFHPDWTEEQVQQAVKKAFLYARS